MPNINIIGSGVAGLSSACFAAKEGLEVSVFEKNSQIGGRARHFTSDGFTFDMGPSWYWMPDIFDRFFNYFGKSTSDYYKLIKLDPGFRMYFGKDDYLDVPAGNEELENVFEKCEPGSSSALKKYLQDAEFKYKEGMLKLAYLPGISLLEFAKPSLLSSAAKLKMFSPVSKHVRSYFKNPRLRALMEFPVLFLGAMADEIPALYSLMNYAALVQGTFYPMGGMFKIIDGMKELAISLGVKFYTDSPVSKINTFNNQVTGITVNDKIHASDAVIATGDYNHIENSLLESKYRNYSEKFWEKKTFAPSCLIFYIGVKRQIPGLLHHNLFFDTDFEKHANEIYKSPKWPSAPLFYVCCPSKTDDSVAPVGCENLFILMPVAVGLEDSKAIQNDYFHLLIERMEQICGVGIKEEIIYKSVYSIENFKQDYNAYKGNAYGLANILSQTAVLKPKIVNKKLSNLFYAGQLTVPGPGLPPSIISGQIAAELTIKKLKYN